MTITINHYLGYPTAAPKVCVYRAADTDNVREKKIFTLLPIEAVAHREVENEEVR